jgi:type VI protein secretion system component Hcp
MIVGARNDRALEGNMRTIALRLATLSLALAAPSSAGAYVIDLFDLPGLGTDLPVESYSFPISKISPSPTVTQTAEVSDFTLIRVVDSTSPALATAVVLGTYFPTATLRVYQTSIASSLPYLTFDFEDLIASSYSISGSWNDATLAESVGFTYAKVTLHYLEGGPGDKPNPWGTIMPLSWPSATNPDGTVDLLFALSANGPDLPGGVTPDFPFTPNLLRVTSPADPGFAYVAPALDGTSSALGELLPPTLPVPEPSAFALACLGAGLVLRGSRARRS